MRIISGQFKGHKFYPPADKWPTRPTTDISKEGLFNILQNEIDFDDCRMLDLFGGTGNHSFEFISRGCEDVTYVDKYRPAVQFVKKQCAQWEICNRIKIYSMDVKQFIKRFGDDPFDYIFAGPPYPLPWLDIIPDLIMEYKILNKEGLLVLEHNPNHNFETHSQYDQSRKYGKTIFSFFRWECQPGCTPYKSDINCDRPDIPISIDRHPMVQLRTRRILLRSLLSPHLSARHHRHSHHLPL